MSLAGKWLHSSSVMEMGLAKCVWCAWRSCCTWASDHNPRVCPAQQDYGRSLRTSWLRRTRARCAAAPPTQSWGRHGGMVPRYQVLIDGRAVYAAAPRARCPPLLSPRCRPRLCRASLTKHCDSRGARARTNTYGAADCKSDNTGDESNTCIRTWYTR